MQPRNGNPPQGPDLQMLDLTELEPENGRRELMRAVEHAPAGGVLEVRMGFDPASCIAASLARRHSARVAWHAHGQWGLEVRGIGAPEIMDLRELEAPEPLERILESAARLAPGEALFARTPRNPRMLFSQLERRGLQWETIEEPDHSALVCVRRPAD
jgi:hypothetical protein